MRLFALCLISLLCVGGCAVDMAGHKAYEADVIVYGGTSAGVIAASQVAQMGRSVIVVCPDRHLGGLSSGGLGWTDTGR